MQRTWALVHNLCPNFLRSTVEFDKSSKVEPCPELGVDPDASTDGEASVVECAVPYGETGERVDWASRTESAPAM
ncbi:hypothetical protein RSOLAG1IB_00576 [Rhizoctonia solani AG-1 IB]|uniref:Uncharacterized protein n=1 Tax=Thanatephorus cucumeris (strain AG1-IB / isolate 7/3/14) TaxID=1108050 RepID=A0A0B7F514_THACB|nr:hypothetical protein RSOLAG1IB_00576 [Rhizoctonia solani AG-1 IB]